MLSIKKPVYNLILAAMTEVKIEDDVGSSVLMTGNNAPTFGGDPEDGVLKQILAQHKELAAKRRSPICATR